MILCCALLIGLLFVATPPASAETTPSATGIPISPAGHVITRKTLADCKRQARTRKLNYVRQRSYVRKCVGP